MAQQSNTAHPAERQNAKPATTKNPTQAPAPGAKVSEGTVDKTALPIVQQLLGIQQELKVAKAHTNEEREFSYRSLPDILDAIKPLLKEYGCVLTFRDEVKCVTPGVVHIVGTAILTNSRGEEFSASATVREDFQRAGMMLAQMSGSSLSYCHKYACGNLFAIDDTRTESVMDPDAFTQGPAAGAPAGGSVPEGERPILMCGAAGWTDAVHLASHFQGTQEEFETEVRRRWKAGERENALLLAIFGSKGSVSTGSGR